MVVILVSHPILLLNMFHPVKTYIYPSLLHQNLINCSDHDYIHCTKEKKQESRAYQGRLASEITCIAVYHYCIQIGITCVQSLVQCLLLLVPFSIQSSNM